MQEILEDMCPDAGEVSIKETVSSILARWEESGTGNETPATQDLVREVDSLDLTEKMHQITQQKLDNFTSRYVQMEAVTTNLLGF